MKTKLLKGFVFGVSFIVGIIIGYFALFAALDWSSVPTNVNTETPLTPTLWNNTMSGIINNVESVASKVGTIANVVTVQTRIQNTYTSPGSGNGTAIDPLTIIITPKKAGNKVILEWNVNGEMHQDNVYIVTRNGILLTDTTDVSNNRWAGITSQPYDVDTVSTPDNAIIKIIDNNTLSVTSTYELRVRSSSATPRALYLNRTANNYGQDVYETSLSTGTAMEIWN
ncbi:MAG: hypothetical protein PHE25_01245 [Candidatus Gracilibacteria bacterium]|nr:hypothetical protein [Candidatus Gracilibacteria bacterium]